MAEVGDWIVTVRDDTGQGKASRWRKSAICNGLIGTSNIFLVAFPKSHDEHYKHTCSFIQCRSFIYIYAYSRIDMDISQSVSQSAGCVLSIYSLP